jgi:hypothetical protein
MSMTAVAVSEAGTRFVVAWKDVRTGSPRVWWSAAAEPQFTRDRAVAEDAKADQNHPTLALDARGTAWVAWEEGRGAAARLRLRSDAPGDRPTDLTDPAQGVPAFPVLAVGAGRRVVAWETTGPGGDRVFVRILEGGTH